MNQIIMSIMAVGAVIGGIDRIFGNRLGLGEKFENGFKLLGSIGLSMAGIIALAPVISDLLGGVVSPVLMAIGVDPGMFGSILAIDMGGFQLATSLALDPQIGLFSGTVVAAIFGCTLVFVIPVGMATVAAEGQNLFAKGLLYGLIIMPVSMTVGGLAAGLTILEIIWQCIPIFLISGFLLVGIVFFLDPLIRGFKVFAKIIQIISTIGLTLGAVQHMTGWEILPGMTPLQESMKVVTGISIVMLGSMPTAELLQRVLKRPLGWIQKKTGMNTASTASILAATVSVTLALVMMRDMDKRGKIVSAAFVVSASGILAAHLGTAVSLAPSMVVPMILAKLTGGLLGMSLALIATRNMYTEMKA